MFDGLAIYDTDSFNMADERGADRIAGAAVTYDFPAVLGIAPVLGRMFTAEEDRPKGPPVVVIGDGLWRERFGGRTDVLGRTLKLNGVAHTIIGVMPREAEFPGGVRLWVPFAAQTVAGQAHPKSSAVSPLSATEKKTTLASRSKFAHRGT